MRNRKSFFTTLLVSGPMIPHLDLNGDIHVYFYWRRVPCFNTRFSRAPVANV